jgi:meiotic recombination protein DMC1
MQLEQSETIHPCYSELDKLLAFGINAGDLSKLKSAGLCTVLGVLMTTRKELISIKGLSDGKVDKILEAAQKCESSAFMTAVELREKRLSVFKLNTGSTALNNLLGGGIESMSITEAFGEYRSGKTQIALTLCVTAQMPRSMGGGAGKVAYIDTEGTFRPDRVAQIASRYNLDPDAVLSNIVYARAYTVEHKFQLLTLIAGKMIEEPFSLLVIDSIMSLFRVDYSGRGELSERQQVLGKLLSRIMKIAEQFNVAVYLTNQVMADPGGGMTFVQDPKKPVGGHILAHACTTRLSLRKGKAEQRVCKIIDSPCLPEGEATFQIGLGGVEEATE